MMSLIRLQFILVFETGHSSGKLVEISRRCVAAENLFKSHTE
jgi:hypothetical protein